MALKLNNRVKETAPAPGTSPFALAGAVTGFRTFASKLSNGDTAYYSAWDGAGNWEVGLGTYTSSGNTLARTTVLDSSNSGSAVNFAAGVTIWNDAPASKLPIFDGVGAISVGTAWKINADGTGFFASGGFNILANGAFNASTNFFSVDANGAISAAGGIFGGGSAGGVINAYNPEVAPYPITATARARPMTIVGSILLARLTAAAMPESCMATAIGSTKTIHTARFQISS